MSDDQGPKFEPSMTEDQPVQPEETEHNTDSVVDEGQLHTEAETTESILERLQAELHQANDRLLRTQAELDNYRKRTRREMADERRYAQMPIIRDLVKVVDNLHRAIHAAEQTDNLARLLEGVKLVLTQIASVLDQHHCQRMEVEGTLFDPNLHEAISQQPSPDQPEGTVLHVTQVGYRLHDRVVRPAQVVVSTSVPSDTTNHNEGGNKEELE